MPVINQASREEKYGAGNIKNGNFIDPARVARA